MFGTAEKKAFLQKAWENLWRKFFFYKIVCKKVHREKYEGGCRPLPSARLANGIAKTAIFPNIFLCFFLFFRNKSIEVWGSPFSINKSHWTKTVDRVDCVINENEWTIITIICKDLSFTCKSFNLVGLYIWNSYHKHLYFRLMQRKGPFK